MRKPNIVKNITKLREGKGLSKKEFAQRLNVTPSAIYQIENIGKKPSLKMALKICEVLGVTKEELGVLSQKKYKKKLQNGEPVKKTLNNMENKKPLINLFMNLSEELNHSILIQTRIKNILKFLIEENNHALRKTTAYF